MKKILFLFLSSLLLFSCKNELERPTWDVDMIAPLLHSKMSIDNILTDSTLQTTENEEGFISLVFQQDFIDVNFDSLIKIESVSEAKTFKIDSVDFADVVIEQVTTLGSVINDIPLGSFLFPNGSQKDIPAMPGVIQNDTLLVDASEYFETMTLYNGMLNLKLKNDFPTDIANVSFSLYNTTNQNLIANFTVALIPSGTTYTESVSIAGETLDYLMVGIIDNMDVAASNGLVLINYADAITTEISITEIQIMEATAYFPKQLLHEEFVEQPFDLGSARITEIGIKSGSIKINAQSTLPDTATIIYSIPSLTKNGVKFETEVKVPHNINGIPSVFTFDFEGYTMNLTGEEGRNGGDTINTIYTKFQAYLDSTGELETIHQVDSFYMYNEFDIIPAYAKGYIGEDTITFGPEEIETNIFNKLSSGDIDLKEASIKLSFENYFGADAAIQINEFSTLNTNSGQTANATVDQNGNPIIGTMYPIERANETNNGLPIIPTFTEITLEASEMFQVLPDKMTSHLNFYLNPNGEQSIPDFLYTDYPLNASFNMEVPLSFIANEITLIDTNDVSIGNLNAINIEKVYITVKNGLPLDAAIKLVLLDEQDLVIDTLLNNTSIIAAGVDDNNKVNKINTTTLEIDYSNFDHVKKIISVASFTSQPVNEYINIYSNYKMDITLSAKFSKTLGN